jgi:stress response protein YsnF
LLKYCSRLFNQCYLQSFIAILNGCGWRRVILVAELGQLGNAIPVVQEEAFVSKRLVDTEHVRVRTSVEEAPVVVRDTVSREHVEIRRVTIEREIERAPATREENGVTIIPVLEERLVVEKRLFLVEEIHVVRAAAITSVELPATLRRTRVDVDRQDLTTNEEDDYGRS